MIDSLQLARLKLLEDRPLTSDECDILFQALLDEVLTQNERERALKAIDKSYSYSGPVSEPIDEVEGLPRPDIRLLQQARRFLENHPALTATQPISPHEFQRARYNWPAIRELLRLFTASERQANERREHLMLELAKLMSLNDEFQATLKAVRRKWQITPYFPALSEIEHMGPDEILLDRVFNSQIYKGGNWEKRIQAWYALQNDVKVRFSFEFPRLNWRIDYGLIVVALCFGIQPEDVTDNWAVIWHVAQYRPSSRDVEPLKDLSPKLMGAMLTIRYLSTQIQKSALPNEIAEWIDVAQDASEALGLSNAQIAPAIRAIYGLPDSSPVGDPALVVRIHPDTVRSDIIDLWPRVNIQQIMTWGKPSHRRIKEWTSFLDDTFLWRLHKKHNRYKTLIEEYDKTHPQQPIVPSGSKAEIFIDLMKKRLRRIRERLWQLQIS